MRTKPSESELTNLPTWSQDERLHYFLTRAVEAEEIWSLGNASGWELREQDGRTLAAVWPYQDLARLNLSADGLSASPQATSLDHFFEKILPIMIEQGIDLEVLSLPAIPGKLIAAAELHALLESMLESGEYFLEG